MVLVKVSIPTGRSSLVLRVCQVQPCCADIQVSMGCAQPLTSMLRTSSSARSSTSATESAVKYDEVDGSGKLVKKLSESRKIVKKSKKPQRSEKFAKAIGSEERLPKHRSSVN